MGDPIAHWDYQRTVMPLGRDHPACQNGGYQPGFIDIANHPGLWPTARDSPRPGRAGARCGGQSISFCTILAHLQYSRDVLPT
jgi:hypothetical protein